YVLLARIIHSPLSNPSYSFRATAASPSSHCRVRPLSSAAVRPCSHCPQVSNSPALFFRELSPSPTLCIFLPSASSSCHRLHLLAVVWSVSSINQGSVGVVFEGFNQELALGTMKVGRLAKELAADVNIKRKAKGLLPR
ncbi:hypothetical protein S245_049943, partial [Arachis hypogaea]